MISLITIVGIGDRKAGVGKNGKPYAFTPVHYTRKDAYVNGLVAESANIDDQTLSKCRPEIGKTYEAVTHYANFHTYVDAILSEVK